MIISVNSKPSPIEFRSLMSRTDLLLNKDALKRPEYYAKRGGNPLEDDVRDALVECSKGTPFEGTIEKVSGYRFPDIVAAKFYGVEVKSTKDNHWTSTGSSILESTRISTVEHIYMTFGKLGGRPIQFLSKPYEECLYGIAVTHMPRYLIDMQLRPEETIFAKMGITYDSLRRMDNPVVPVARYYRKQLKDGESLWWTGDNSDETVSAKIRLWKNLTPDEKRFHTIYGCANYPEIFGGDYDRYALWLTSQGVVDPHIRDQFSAGGQEEMLLSSGEKIKFPAVYRRVKAYKDLFIRRMSQKDPKALVEIAVLDKEALNRRLWNWADLVSKRTNMKYEVSMDALNVLFHESLQNKRSAVKTNPHEKVVTCAYCGKRYIQRIEPQLEGHRIREIDECPYCYTANQSSMEWEYHNRKMTD